MVVFKIDVLQYQVFLVLRYVSLKLDHLPSVQRSGSEISGVALNILVARIRNAAVDKTVCVPTCFDPVYN